MLALISVVATAVVAWAMRPSWWVTRIAVLLWVAAQVAGPHSTLALWVGGCALMVFIANVVVAAIGRVSPKPS